MKTSMSSASPVLELNAQLSGALSFHTQTLPSLGKHIQKPSAYSSWELLYLKRAGGWFCTELATFLRMTLQWMLSSFPFLFSLWQLVGCLCGMNLFIDYSNDCGYFLLKLYKTGSHRHDVTILLLEYQIYSIKTFKNSKFRGPENYVNCNSSICCTKS